DDTNWPPRLSLPTAPTVPTLPATMIPRPILHWLADVAERACFHLEFVVIPAIIAAAAVIGRSVGIRPWRYDDYLVVPNLWGGVVARPGMMKSYAIEEGTSPLTRLAAAATKEFEDAQGETAARIARLAAELSAITDAMRQRAKADRGIGAR